MSSYHREMTGNKDLRAENTARVTVPFSRQNFVDLSNTRTSLIRAFFKIQYPDYRVLMRSDCISKTVSSQLCTCSCFKAWWWSDDMSSNELIIRALVFNSVTSNCEGNVKLESLTCSLWSRLTIWDQYYIVHKITYVLRGVQAFHFGKKDYEIEVWGEGQDTSRHFEGSFESIRAILPMWGLGAKLGQTELKEIEFSYYQYSICLPNNVKIG